MNNEVCKNYVCTQLKNEKSNYKNLLVNNVFCCLVPGVVLCTAPAIVAQTVSKDYALYVGLCFIPTCGSIALVLFKNGTIYYTDIKKTEQRIKVLKKLNRELKKEYNRFENIPDNMFYDALNDLTENKDISVYNKDICPNCGNYLNSNACMYCGRVFSKKITYKDM